MLKRVITIDARLYVILDEAYQGASEVRRGRSNTEATNTPANT